MERTTIYLVNQSRGRMTIMIRKGIAILLIICMSSIVMSCDNDKIIENTSSADYEIPEKLNIYIVSDAVHEY